MQSVNSNIIQQYIAYMFVTVPFLMALKYRYVRVLRRSLGPQIVTPPRRQLSTINHSSAHAAEQTSLVSRSLIPIPLLNCMLYYFNEHRI